MEVAKAIRHIMIVVRKDFNWLPRFFQGVASNRESTVPLSPTSSESEKLLGAIGRLTLIEISHQMHVSQTQMNPSLNEFSDPT